MNKIWALNYFRQNLKDQRSKIDSLLIKKNEQFLKTKIKVKKIGKYNNFINFIKIYNTRKIVFASLSNFFSLKNKNEYKSSDEEVIKIYFDLVNKLNKKLNDNKSKLILVYLPTDKYEFSGRGTYLRETKKKIFTEMNNNNIDTIDIESRMKKSFILPNVLYPKFSTGNHFNRKGYKFIAENISKYINKNDKK